MGFSSKNTGVGCHFLLQGLFPIQGTNPCLLHCGWVLYHGATWEGTADFLYSLWEGRHALLSNDCRRSNNYATQLNAALTPLKERFRWGLYSLTEQKVARATRVHHGMHAQFCKWPQLLHNHAKALFTKRGVTAKGHGAREPDHCHLG